MKKNIEKISEKAWLPPGSLVYVGQVKNQPIRIVGMDYDESGCEEWESVTVDEKLPSKKKKFTGYTWMVFTSPKWSSQLEIYMGFMP